MQAGLRKLRRAKRNPVRIRRRDASSMIVSGTRQEYTPAKGVYLGDKRENHTTKNREVPNYSPSLFSIFTSLYPGFLTSTPSCVTISSTSSPNSKSPPHFLGNYKPSIGINFFYYTNLIQHPQTSLFHCATSYSCLIKSVLLHLIFLL